MTGLRIVIRSLHDVPRDRGRGWRCLCWWENEYEPRGPKMAPTHRVVSGYRLNAVSLACTVHGDWEAYKRLAAQPGFDPSQAWDHYPPWGPR